jgi:OOP family OmpA-OmpF porin
MFKCSQASFHKTQIAAIIALTSALITTPATALEEESYWYAKGDFEATNGQLWATQDGQCWQSAYPDGPTNLPPCVTAVVPEEFTVRLNFEFNKFGMENVVNRDELARLDDYIGNVKATPAEEYLTVIGHTDVVGSDAYNYNLGMNRAQSVRNYMVAQGIAADHIAPAQSRGEQEMLPGYPPDSVYQRRVRITSEARGY